VKVSIIGLGYVGLPIAVHAAEAGYTVGGFDIDSNKINQLESGISDSPEVSPDQILSLKAQGKLFFSSNISDHKDSSIYVIAVPTPLEENNSPDLSYLRNACELLAKVVKSGDLVINESTSYIGTLRNLIKPIIEESSGLLDLRYAVAPERIDPGNKDWNIKNTPRNISGLTDQATSDTATFYSGFCDSINTLSKPEVAEAAKLFENTFRQVNIALVNEFAQIANALGISVYETLNAANTKPYGFMKFTPSAGVGGHCIPVDPTYLAAVAEERGVPATFIRRANEVNLEMSKYIVNRVEADNGGTLQGKSVLVVGVAYKPNVADVRETAAELVIEHLRSRGAIVAWHDDVVGTWHGEKSSDLNGADISIVITKHDVVDARNIMASAPYVFDTTGKLPQAHGL
jgi:UDP-N-acetyl-D-glucosamine dehydrogenase